MKTLLIPTDFSEISRNSIIFGFKLAEKYNLKVQLVHVLELYKFAAGTSEAELISTILPADNIHEMESVAKEGFKKIVSEISTQVEIKVPYETKVVSGHLVNEMIVESAFDEVELMILAVAGNEDLITRFSSSTISSILDEAICPVLVVPSGASFKNWEKVVLATDFNKAELQAARQFIDKFGSNKPQIEVIHITSKQNDFKTDLKFAGFKQLLLEATNYPNFGFKLITHKNTVQGILEATKVTSADILIMLKEHESFFKSLFDTSTAEKITHYLKIPMISYRESREQTKNI